jgi:hypothetical protein
MAAAGERTKRDRFFYYYRISSTNKKRAQFSALFWCLSRRGPLQPYASDWPQHAPFLHSTNQLREPHSERSEKPGPSVTSSLLRAVALSCTLFSLVGSRAAAQHQQQQRVSDSHTKNKAKHTAAPPD